MHIPLVYEHLFYKYNVRRSVGQATKGKRASLLMDVVILVIQLFLNIFHAKKNGNLIELIKLAKQKMRINKYFVPKHNI